MELKDLICLEAQYILEHQTTVRETGFHFGRSKSVVHHDLRNKLPYINNALATAVAELFEANLKDRARRGGEATRRKVRVR